MKFENTAVTNFEGAFRGLRNPLESWDKSDSVFGISDENSEKDFEIASRYCEANGISFEDYKAYDETQSEYAEWLRKNGILRTNIDYDYFIEYAYIGPKDLDLAHRMIKAGVSDSKFLRQIFVSVDITAPLYWWKEMDQYKIGTITNSTSTMHKLASTPITIDCFETDDYNPDIIIFEQEPYNIDSVLTDCVEDIINICETLRKKYLETKDKRYWKELIRWLPESWLQTRTWTANYTILRNIYFQRQNHKLTEWHQCCKWIESLPYSADLITYK